MNDTVMARRQVYRFLYRQKVEAPDTFYDRSDLRPLAGEKQLEAAISFGLEKRHLERYRKYYFRLTADGMYFAESQGWVEDN